MRDAADRLHQLRDDPGHGLLRLGGSDATRTYAFTRTEAQKNSIEQSTYEPIVANELSTYAFRQVPQAQARYLVGLTYAVGSDLVTVPQPVYYDPWFAPAVLAARAGPVGPWGRCRPATSRRRTRRFDYTLGIRITERATGKEVYNVSARTTGDNGTLLYAMPFLARSALADFPLSNGAVRSVRLPVDKRGARRRRPPTNAGAGRACVGCRRREITRDSSRRGRPAAPALLRQTPIPSSASAPSTTNSTAAIACTSFVGRRCAKRSPSRIAGTFASIIPNVVPATTPM